MDVWFMKNAKKGIERREKSRYQILIEAANQECAVGCSGRWFLFANQVLTNNKINPINFAGYVFELLMKGRGKNRNLMLVGPANCGKTFLLQPLEKVFHIFANPAKNMYCWVGAEDSEVIFLNDFHWHEDVIAWHSFLSLLEGSVFSRHISHISISILIATS